MKVCTIVSELERALDESRAKLKSIGFVPTMGALHKGHSALVEQSVNENEVTVVSIFVNPTQFNNQEDLSNYPKLPEQDIAILKAANCDILFLPDVEEMYPNISKNFNTPSDAANVIYENELKGMDISYQEQIMEGKYRPGHFKGVAVIVNKLFALVKPNKAYFGLKDFQQVQVIKQLVQFKKYDISIVECEIVRENDGLAMSSRNQRLTKEQRELSPIIYKTLLKIKQRIKEGWSLSKAKSEALDWLNSFNQLKTEYLEIVAMPEFKIVDSNAENKKLVCCIAVWLGNVKLIDNLIIND